MNVPKLPDGIVALLGFIALVAVMIWLFGCAAVEPRVVTRNVPTPDCAAWGYITVSDDDVLTTKTAEQIVRNDKNWTRLCGPVPPTGGR